MREPGERIVELRLMNKRGTSQAPVPQALRDLDAMRFVDSIPTGELGCDTSPPTGGLFEIAGMD